MKKAFLLCALALAACSPKAEKKIAWDSMTYGGHSAASHKSASILTMSK